LLAELEHGQQALLFGSGMAAAVSVFLALPSGSRVLAPTIMYWALRHWLKTLGRDHGLAVEFVDMTNLQEVEQAFKSAPTQLLWLETPGNPLWTVCDIAALAELAKRYGAMTA